MFIERGFYIIKDEFFEYIKDPYLKGNKEENRPHYYCFKEENGLMWMIPLSSKLNKYEKLLNKKLDKRKKCDIIHIQKLDNGKTSEHSAREIEKKAKKVVEMLKRGVKFTPTQPDIIQIIKKLHKNKF